MSYIMPVTVPVYDDDGCTYVDDIYIEIPIGGSGKTWMFMNIATQAIKETRTSAEVLYGLQSPE